MRRQRFTVHIADDPVSPRVVLAYSADGARACYENRGLTVTSVVKGDYRRTLPITQRGSFTVDQDALAAAIDLLSLRIPVRIRYNARQGGTMGNYRFRNGVHDIMLKSYHDAKQASETLWHELTHAMQCEREMAHGHVWRDVVRAQSRFSYSIRPIELEAREMSRQMADCPLAK